MLAEVVASLVRISNRNNHNRQPANDLVSRRDDPSSAMVGAGAGAAGRSVDAHRNPQRVRSCVRIRSGTPRVSRCESGRSVIHPTHQNQFLVARC